MQVVGILDRDIKKWYNDWDSELKKYRNDTFLRNWIQLVVLDMKYFDIEKKCFTCYKSQSWVFDIVQENIMPEIIRVRTSQDLSRDLTVLEWETIIFPSCKVMRIAVDKRNTYRFLKKHQPKTFLLSEFPDNNTFWEFGIIKPRQWNWWYWIEKVRLNELSQCKLKWKKNNYIIQEVCNFSAWYPWNKCWNHDFRVVYIWWKVFYWELRVNEKSFKANVAQGWVSKQIDPVDIPLKLLEISKKIIAKLWWEEVWLVWVDFWYDNSKSKRVLIEINYSPWYTPEELKYNERDIYLAYNWYANYFKSLVSC
jgi:glutathione synthase/RimK-type ligase-like ATP-grasp enzyme